VGGNVVLTQGKNVLKGDRLVIDLKTGESRFEHTGNATAGGRIRALFMPKQEGGKNAKPDDTKPVATEPGPAAAQEAKPSGDGARSNAAPAGQPDLPWPPLDKTR
jgi:lipopolysaccharide export system protein LptA